MNEGAASLVDRGRAWGWLTIVTGASLALNLLIAGIFIGSSYLAANEAAPSLLDRRFTALAQRLNVDPKSDNALAELHRALRIAIDVRRLRGQALVEDMLTELAKPAPDPDRVQTLQRRVLALRRRGGDEFLDALLAYLAEATPAERATLLGLLRDRKDETTAPLRYGLFP